MFIDNEVQLSIYLTIKDLDKAKVEKLQQEIVQSIKKILEDSDSLPKDLSVRFVWY